MCLKKLIVATKDVIGKLVSLSSLKKSTVNEHECRLAPPGDFQSDQFRRENNYRKHDGKSYHFIFGRKKGKETTSVQAYRYDKKVWDGRSAGGHCKSKGGTFTPASG
jgi:hypothetical protein